MKKLYQDRDWLYEQYWVNHLCLREMGEAASSNNATLLYWMDRFNIARRNKGSLCHYVDIAPDLLEFLNGWMLSDLCIFSKIHNAKSAIIQFETKYKDCTVWMSNKLSSFGIEQVGIIHKRVFDDNNSQTFSYRSRYYRNLLDIRNKWYNSDRKKIVPRDITLTPMVARYWYIGDGSLICRTSSKPSIKLATHGFPEDDVCFLVGMLKDIGIKTSRQKDNSIYIHVRSTQDFLDYIGPCDKGLEHLYYYKWEIDRRGPIVYR